MVGRYGLVILPILCLVCQAVAGDNAWTRIGPCGGCVYGLAVDQTDADTAYVTTNAGLFKTIDRGENWDYVSEDLDCDNGTEGIAIDPGDPNHIFLGVGREGLFHSWDGGQNWSKLNASGLETCPYLEKIIISSSNPEVIYATDSNNTITAVYVSTNQGVDWQKQTNGFPVPAEPYYYFKVRDLAIDPANSCCAYGAANEAGLWLTNDLGDTWNQVSGDLPQGVTSATVAFEYGSSSTIFAGTAEQGIYRSQDSGSTWALDLNTQGRFYSILSHPALPGDLYAGRIFNGGDIFKRTSSDPWEWMAAGISCTYHLAAGLTDSTVVYGAGMGGVYVTSDSGTTWVRKITGITAANISVIAVAPTNADYVYTSMWDTNLMRSQNRGLTWEQSGDALPTTMDTIAVNISKPEDIFVGTRGMGIHFSSDYGDTWAPKTDAYPEIGLVAKIKIAPSNNNVVYAALKSQYVFRSPDYGNTWIDISSGIPASISFAITDLDVDPRDENIAYLTYQDGMAGDGGVYKKSGAADWQPVNQGLPADTLGFSVLVHPYNPDTIYVGTMRGVYRSSDAGANWHSYCVGYENILGQINALVLMPPTAPQPETLFAGTWCRGVYRTLDQGATWQLFETEGPGRLTDLALDLDQLTIYASTTDCSVFAYTFNLATPVPTSTPTPVNAPELTPGQEVLAYPNPAKGDQVTFVYYVEEDSQITIRIYNSAGRLVTTLSENKTGGAPAFTIWDISPMPGGIYFYRLEVNGKCREIKKLAILKN